MRARRHPVIYRNGHRPDLRGEPLRKSVSDDIAEARALLDGTAKSTKSREEVDTALAKFLGRS